MDVEDTVNTTAVFITAGMELGDTVHEGQLQDRGTQPYTQFMAPERRQRLRSRDDVAIARSQLDWGTT